MPLDPALVADSLYDEGSVLIDEVLEVDLAKSLVRVRMPTHADLPLTRDQRVHPTRHPRHVSGGLMVHMTGVAGWVHAYHVLGLRQSEGWTGYGVRIHSARFHALAPPGEPIEITAWCTNLRRGPERILGRYSFRFTQAEKLVYEGDQTAMWMKVPGPPDREAVG